MFPFLAQAQDPIDLNGGTLGYGIGVLKQTAAQTESLKIVFGNGIFPLIVGISFTFAFLLLSFNLITFFYTQAAGKSTSALPNLGGLFFRTVLIVVLLGGSFTPQGGPATSIANPSVNATNGRFEPKDNASILVFFVTDLFDGLQRGMARGSAKALFEARTNYPVCVIQPPADLTLPVAKDGQFNTGVTAAQQGDPRSGDEIVCKTVDSTQANVADQVQAAKGTIKAKPNLGDRVRDGVLGGIPGVAAAGIIFNFAKDNIPQALLVFIQLLEAPVIYALTITQRVALIILWGLIPFAICTMMLDNTFIKRWITGYFQVNLWGIVAQLLIAMISFIRVGLQVDPSNPATQWIGVSYTLAIFGCILITPAICSFADGIFAKIGGLAGDAFIAATAVTLASSAAAGRGGANAVDQQRANRFINERSSTTAQNMRDRFTAEGGSGEVGKAYMRDVSSGKTTDSVDQWIDKQARSSAIKEAQETKRQNRDLGIKS
jgi:hypothetical protein